MIGVLADSSNRAVISEFFELFKTPWEFYRRTGDYRVLICSGAAVPSSSAEVIFVCGRGSIEFDRQNGISVLSERDGALVTHDKLRLQIYGRCLTFSANLLPLVRDDQTGAPVVVGVQIGGQTFVRVGFDLFDEINHLLGKGQPPTHAQSPTVDLHIALLRRLILRHCRPLIEVPPIPAGHPFIACLTHDVDHAGIRKHRCDHTMLGFLYRATIGSLNSFCRGRRSFRHLAANWMAAFSLPLVYLGLVKDFWSRFDRYLDIEKGAPSTFFIIPKKMEAGQDVRRPSSWKRAAKYDVEDVSEQLGRLASAGAEIGLHGIDAWRDVGKGIEERKQIERVTGASAIGVRMHWLCFDENSPRTLERSGFSYDSTVGYNDTIGYRAGTTQVFKPLQVDRMLELPMHIMDTALFYPTHLNLSPRKAGSEIHPLVENARRYGGVLTVNWHDRSIAPERLWEDSYVELLNELAKEGAWFATASQCVSWFQRRRSAIFQTVTNVDGTAEVSVSISPTESELPGLRLRIYESETEFTDTCFSKSSRVEIVTLRSAVGNF